MTVYYKIRNKQTGLFVKGTPHYLSSDKTGRIFQKMGQLRTFLTGVMNRRWGASFDFNDWEIVELEMVVKDTKQVIYLIDPKKIVEILAR
jgi:hypothetical protein